MIIIYYYIIYNGVKEGLKNYMKITRIISAILCFSILFVTICPKAETLDTKTYVKEIVTSTAQTDAAAKKWLTDNGYIVVPSNINAGTDEDPVYLGYKTTTKKSEAITDISFMDMDGGYEWMDYEAFATQNQNNIAEMTRNLSITCKEMKSNLDNGSKAATVALSYLNIFTVPEANQKLGDYLLDSSRTDTDYRRILLICNSLVINIIYSQLSLGCTESSTDNFITRLSSSGPDCALRGEDCEEYWNEKSDNYSKDAKNILTALQAFEKEYNFALARKTANGGEIVTPSASTENEAENQLASFAENGSKTADGDTDALTFSVYEYLNQYDYTSTLPTTEGENYRLFPNSTKLGDLILELSKIDKEDEEQLSLLYPLVESLTPAQRYLLCTQGFTGFTSIAISDDETLTTLEQKHDEYANMLYSALDSDVASVWVGTNKDLFDQKIGITTKAKRDADASSDYDELTKVTNFDTNIKVALCYIGAAAAATAGVSLIVIGVGAFIFKGAVATVACGISIMTGAISATVSGVAFGCVGAIGIALTGLVVAALIVCAIVYAVDYFVDLYNYYHPDYSEIPAVMVDSYEDGYITYKAVKNNKGKPADINIWEGRRWNALYVTTDENAGSPLTVNSDGLAFKVIYGSTSIPQYSSPVARFGTTKAVNLNSNTYDDDVNGIYLYFYPENLVQTKTEESQSEGQKVGPTEDAVSDNEPLYLESLILLTHKDARVVKNLIALNSGYNLIDINLTPNTNWASYIGYTTTKNPANAITDIRVSYAGSRGKYYFGTVTDTYGMAGTLAETTEGEATDLMVSLYYTKSKNRGTPIYADMLISNSRKPIGYEFEPVNLFSGGDAFDFNIYPEEDSDNWKRHTYIYFRPSVVYNVSNSTEYLGGISFVSGSTDMSKGKLDAYVSELKMKSCGIDLSKGFLNDEDRTWLCYSTTYNPYRAIYDIGVYTAEYKSESLPENLVLDGSGYIACQTFTQGDISYYGNTFWGGNYRLIRPDHAYITRTEDYGGDDEYGDTLVCNRGMYVSGPITGKNPITMDGFTISTKSTIPAGCVAVHDMTDKYASSALNLAMFDGDRKNNLYIFYKGTAPVKQKYISGVSVFFSSEEDYSYDTVMYSLMSAGGDEIIKVNLASEKDDSWTYTNGSACFDEDSDRDDYDDAHAYIRVTRTKTKNEAIGSLCMVEGKKGGTSTLTLPVNLAGNTALYHLAGGKITYDENKSYYLYYSNVGNKVSDIKIDKVAVQHDWITALNENLKLSTNKGYYFHTYSDASLPYYSLVMFHRSNNKLTSISALLAAGCTDVERINQSGDPVYIGWTKTSSIAKGIKDIRLSDTSELPSGSDVYVKGGSAHGVNIFYTVSGDKNKVITHLKVGKSTPTEFGENLKWDCALTVAGKTANLNKVVENTNTKNTYRLYINHKDNNLYSSTNLAASIFGEKYKVITIIPLCAIPLLGACAFIFIRKKKILFTKER